MDIFQEEIDLNDIVEILEKTDLLIIEYEDSLLQNNEKSELIHIIFRHIHNLKGLLFSTDKKLSSQLIHIIESNFDLIRKNVIQASKEILEKSLNGLDLIKKNILNDNEFIEESEFLIKILEECYETKKVLQDNLFIVKAPLDSKELEKLKYAEDNNLNIFQIEKLLNSDITKEEFDTLFIYQDIKEIGNLICSFPKFEDINKNEPQIVLKIIFATYMDDNELEMHIFDTFKKVKVELGKEDITNIEPMIFEENLLQPKDKKLKFLVLEADFFNRRILQNTLLELGACDIAINLDEAFYAYKYEYESNYRYDYIFIDSNFESNISLIKLIKNHQKENSINSFEGSKFILLADEENNENIINLLKNNVSLFLLKPIEKESLLDYLKNNTALAYNLSDELKNLLIIELVNLIQSLVEKQNSNLNDVYEQLFIIKNIASFINFTNLKNTLEDLFLIYHKKNEEDFSTETLLKDIKDFLNQALEEINLTLSDKNITNTKIREAYNLTNVEVITENKKYSTFEINMDTIINDQLIQKYIFELSENINNIESKIIDFENNSAKKNLMEDLLGCIHNLKGNSGFLGINVIENNCIELENLLSPVLDKKTLFNKNLISLTLEKIDSMKNFIENYIIEFNENISKNDFNDISTGKKFSDFEKTEGGEKNNEKNLAPNKKDIRVSTDKVDNLFDLVGELITNQAQLSINSKVLNNKESNFSKNLLTLNKTIREIQELTMSIRLIPIEGVFNRMKRLVRDLSYKTDKKVNFIIHGQDIEMDKNIIEQISDPLIHLLRNAIDHGIENETERAISNKNPIGTIKLQAKYEGNQVLITIEDDGKGLDRDKILAKAKERGLINKEITDLNSLADKEIWNYIFEAGFSTSEVVSELSGRGVGMDVVKKNIEKLCGKIEVESVKSFGSKITLRIPLTLAIIDAMLFKVAETVYAIPILAIKKSFRPDKKDITITMDGQEVVKIKDELYKVIRLHESFKLTSESKPLEQGILIALEDNNYKACFFVDELIAQQQIVVKAFDNYIGNKKGFMGCMVLGNSEIGLILDVESILEMAEK